MKHLSIEAMKQMKHWFTYSFFRPIYPPDTQYISLTPPHLPGERFQNLVGIVGPQAFGTKIV